MWRAAAAMYTHAHVRPRPQSHSTVFDGHGGGVDDRLSRAGRKGSPGRVDAHATRSIGVDG